MFSKFTYTPTNYLYNNVLNSHFQTGNEMYNCFQNQSQKVLSDFIYENGRIDGTALQEHWFNIKHADIFLSHSHKDINRVKAFAGWLFDTFGLTSFIDSCTWGYCDELLREIDDTYCYNKTSATYNYELRNYTTSHVHMMLSSALSQMIDKTECIIFFNTPNSIVLKDDITSVKSEVHELTLSPWIYHELSMSTMIRQTSPTRFAPILEHSSQHSNEVRDALEIQYDVSDYLKAMKTLNDYILSEWEREWERERKSNYNSKAFPLDFLYRTIKEKTSL